LVHAQIACEENDGCAHGLLTLAAVRYAEKSRRSREATMNAAVTTELKLIGHWIGGESVRGESDRKGPVYNPATGEPSGEVDFASVQEIDRAVAPAKKAFSGWPKGAPPEVELVRQGLEDLILGEFPLQRQRQHGLAQLAGIAAAVVEEDGAGKLLGDRRGGAQPLARHHGHITGTDQTDRMDPGVRPEAAIVDGYHRGAH